MIDLCPVLDFEGAVNVRSPGREERQPRSISHFIHKNLRKVVVFMGGGTGHSH